MPLWVYHPTATDAAVVAHTRAMIREARDLLGLPMPDTFLGAKPKNPSPRSAGLTCLMAPKTGWSMMAHD